MNDLEYRQGAENMDFIELIVQAIVILQKKEMDDNYAIFSERYEKMRIYLESLRKAYVNKTLNNTKICLNIVRMIEHGDDDELQDAIVAVNRYYQDNIYK